MNNVPRIHATMGIPSVTSGDILTKMEKRFII